MNTPRRPCLAVFPLRAVVSLVLAAPAVQAAPPPPPPAAAQPYAASTDVNDVAHRWTRLTIELMRRERLGATAVARILAYEAVAMNESAVPELAGATSFASRLNDLAELPRPPAGSPPIDAALAINAASAQALRSLLANRGDEVTRAIDGLESEVASSCSATQPVRDAARRHGRTVADAVIAWSTRDGFAQLPKACAYGASKKPGRWVPTPPAFRQQPLQPCWDRLRTFAVRTCDACGVAPPTPYSEDTGSAFHREALEVMQVVERQDRREQEIALFWSDDPGTSPTPPGHWLALFEQLAAERKVPPEQYLRDQAVLAVTMADSSISCWHAKYQYDSIRPVTYIQARLKPAWVPLIETPPFPEHPSGHSVFSGAAARVLAVLLGDGPFEDRTKSVRGHAPHRFDSFEAAAEEAAMSRLYAGIHFRTACVEGLKQGRCVADAALARLAEPAAPAIPR